MDIAPLWKGGHHQGDGYPSEDSGREKDGYPPLLHPRSPHCRDRRRYGTREPKLHKKTPYRQASPASPCLNKHIEEENGNKSVLHKNTGQARLSLLPARANSVLQTIIFGPRPENCPENICAVLIFFVHLHNRISMGQTDWMTKRETELTC